jgi:hypothetical protein
MYWSTQDARRRCIYTLRIFEVKPREEVPEFAEDVTYHHDMNHPEYIAPTEIPGFRSINLSVSVEENISPKITELLDETLGSDSDLKSDFSRSYPGAMVSSMKTDNILSKSWLLHDSLEDPLKQLSPSTLKLLGDVSKKTPTPIIDSDDLPNLSSLTRIAQRLNTAAAKSRSREGSVEKQVPDETSLIVSSTPELKGTPGGAQSTNPPVFSMNSMITESDIEKPASENVAGASIELNDSVESLILQLEGAMQDIGEDDLVLQVDPSIFDQIPSEEEGGSEVIIMLMDGSEDVSMFMETSCPVAKTDAEKTSENVVDAETNPDNAESLETKYPLKVDDTSPTECPKETLPVVKDYKFLRSELEAVDDTKSSSCNDFEGLQKDFYNKSSAEDAESVPESTVVPSSGDDKLPSLDSQNVHQEDVTRNSANPEPLQTTDQSVGSKIEEESGMKIPSEIGGDGVLQMSSGSNSSFTAEEVASPKMPENSSKKVAASLSTKAETKSLETSAETSNATEQSAQQPSNVEDPPIQQHSSNVTSLNEEDTPVGEVQASCLNSKTDKRVHGQSTASTRSEVSQCQLTDCQFQKAAESLKRSTRSTRSKGTVFEYMDGLVTDMLKGTRIPRSAASKLPTVHELLEMRKSQKNDSETKEGENQEDVMSPNNPQIHQAPTSIGQLQIPGVNLHNVNPPVNVMLPAPVMPPPPAPPPPIPSTSVGMIQNVNRGFSSYVEPIPMMSQPTLLPSVPYVQPSVSLSESELDEIVEIYDEHHVLIGHKARKPVCDRNGQAIGYHFDWVDPCSRLVKQQAEKPLMVSTESQSSLSPEKTSSDLDDGAEADDCGNDSDSDCVVIEDPEKPSPEKNDVVLIAEEPASPDKKSEDAEPDQVHSLQTSPRNPNQKKEAAEQIEGKDVEIRNKRGKDNQPSSSENNTYPGNGNDADLETAEKVKMVKTYPLRRTAQRKSEARMRELEAAASATTNKPVSLHDKIMQKIKAESLARSKPSDAGPYKCKLCKRLYRTQDSYQTHIKTCNFEVSDSEEEESPETSADVQKSLTEMEAEADVKDENETGKDDSVAMETEDVYAVARNRVGHPRKRRSMHRFSGDSDNAKDPTATEVTGVHSTLGVECMQSTPFMEISERNAPTLESTPKPPVVETSTPVLESDSQKKHVDVNRGETTPILESPIQSIHVVESSAHNTPDVEMQSTDVSASLQNTPVMESGINSSPQSVRGPGSGRSRGRGRPRGRPPKQPCIVYGAGPDVHHDFTELGHVSGTPTTRGRGRGRSRGRPPYRHLRTSPVQEYTEMTQEFESQPESTEHVPVHKIRRNPVGEVTDTGFDDGDRVKVTLRSGRLARKLPLHVSDSDSDTDQTPTVAKRPRSRLPGSGRRHSSPRSNDPDFSPENTYRRRSSGSPRSRRSSGCHQEHSYVDRSHSSPNSSPQSLNLTKSPEFSSQQSPKQKSPATSITSGPSTVAMSTITMVTATVSDPPKLNEEFPGATKSVVYIKENSANSVSESVVGVQFAHAGVPGGKLTAEKQLICDTDNRQISDVEMADVKLHGTESKSPQSLPLKSTPSPKDSYQRANIFDVFGMGSKMDIEQSQTSRSTVDLGASGSGRGLSLAEVRHISNPSQKEFAADSGLDTDSEKGQPGEHEKREIGVQATLEGSAELGHSFKSDHLGSAEGVMSNTGVITAKEMAPSLPSQVNQRHDSRMEESVITGIPMSTSDLHQSMVHIQPKKQFQTIMRPIHKQTEYVLSPPTPANPGLGGMIFDLNQRQLPVSTVTSTIAYNMQGLVGQPAGGIAAQSVPIFPHDHMTSILNQDLRMQNLNMLQSGLISQPPTIMPQTIHPQTFQNLTGITQDMIQLASIQGNQIVLPGLTAEQVHQLTGQLPPIQHIQPQQHITQSSTASQILQSLSMGGQQLLPQSQPQPSISMQTWQNVGASSMNISYLGGISGINAQNIPDKTAIVVNDPNMVKTLSAVAPKSQNVTVKKYVLPKQTRNPSRTGSLFRIPMEKRIIQPLQKIKKSLAHKRTMTVTVPTNKSPSFSQAKTMSVPLTSTCTTTSPQIVSRSPPSIISFKKSMTGSSSFVTQTLHVPRVTAVHTVPMYSIDDTKPAPKTVTMLDPKAGQQAKTFKHKLTKPSLKSCLKRKSEGQAEKFISKKGKPWQYTDVCGTVHGVQRIRELKQVPPSRNVDGCVVTSHRLERMRMKTSIEDKPPTGESFLHLLARLRVSKKMSL